MYSLSHDDDFANKTILHRVVEEECGLILEQYGLKIQQIEKTERNTHDSCVIKNDNITIIITSKGSEHCQYKVYDTLFSDTALDFGYPYGTHNSPYWDRIKEEDNSLFRDLVRQCICHSLSPYEQLIAVQTKYRKYRLACQCTNRSFVHEYNSEKSLTKLIISLRSKRWSFFSDNLIYAYKVTELFSSGGVEYINEFYAFAYNGIFIQDSFYESFYKEKLSISSKSGQVQVYGGESYQKLHGAYNNGKVVSYNYFNIELDVNLSLKLKERTINSAHGSWIGSIIHRLRGDIESLQFSTSVNSNEKVQHEKYANICKYVPKSINFNYSENDESYLNFARKILKGELGAKGFVVYKVYEPHYYWVARSRHNDDDYFQDVYVYWCLSFVEEFHHDAYIDTILPKSRFVSLESQSDYKRLEEVGFIIEIDNNCTERFNSEYSIFVHQHWINVQHPNINL